jgi:hypothetical protein
MYSSPDQYNVWSWVSLHVTWIIVFQCPFTLGYSSIQHNTSFTRAYPSNMSSSCFQEACTLITLKYGEVKLWVFCVHLNIELLVVVLVYSIKLWVPNALNDIHECSLRRSWDIVQDRLIPFDGHDIWLMRAHYRDKEVYYKTCSLLSQFNEHLSDIPYQEGRVGRK